MSISVLLSSICVPPPSCWRRSTIASMTISCTRSSLKEKAHEPSPGTLSETFLQPSATAERSFTPYPGRLPRCPQAAAVLRRRYPRKIGRCPLSAGHQPNVGVGFSRSPRTRARLLYPHPQRPPGGHPRLVCLHRPRGARLSVSVPTTAGNSAQAHRAQEHHLSRREPHAGRARCGR